MEKVWDIYKSKTIESIGTKLETLKSTCLLVLIGFFIGRVTLFGFINPFFIAFLANFIGVRQKIYILAIPMALGIVTRFEGLLMLKNLSALSLILLGHMFLNIAGVRPKTMLKILVSGFASMFSGLLFIFLFDSSPYFILMIAGGCIFAISLTVLMKDSALLLSGKHKDALDNEGALSLIIVLGAMVAGAADIYIGNFSLKYILCALIVLMVARRGGAPMGATCGVALGFILTLAGHLNYSLIGVLSVGGIVSGFLKGRGKIASAAGFVVGAVLSAIYIDTGLIYNYFIFSLGAAVALFLVIPDNFSMNISRITINRTIDEAKQAKTLVSQRLFGISASFKNMGKTLEIGAEKQQTLGSKELSRLIDDAVARACPKCPYKNDCWGKNFYKTYQMSFKILEDFEKGHEPNVENSEYSELCKYIGHFSGWLSRQYDIYKLNLSWQNKIAESKHLISQQLLGVSEVLGDLSLEIKQKEIIKNELSEKIANQFAKKNIEVRDVIVLENAYGKFSVSLERKACSSMLNCFREAAKIVSKAIGRKMIVSDKACQKNSKYRSKCRLNFMEEPRFNIVSGAAYAKKDGSIHSGDCHSVMEIRGSQIILALSDGMGSGIKARTESEAAMGLLEDFLEAGFSRELSLRLINSALVLKDGAEHFSTMDICAIDLHSGIAEFVKIGAASTFIKRGQSVAQIVSESLPMGILKEIDAEICKKNIKNGDIIVMVTDGVCDSGEVRQNNDLERNWVSLALEEFDSKDPDDIADYLISLAKKRSDNQVKDDMTVLCARIWEKIS
ncbi:MAG: stage II sporulation protein E [Defluviitaleaceae bacterium]|nr:stage II sporulation protein E [Defluviitaleaceae bacterium]